MSGSGIYKNHPHEEHHQGEPVKKHTSTPVELTAEELEASFKLDPEQSRRVEALRVARQIILDSTGSGLFSAAGHVEGRHQRELVDLAEYIIYGVPDPIGFAFEEGPTESSVATTFNIALTPPPATAPEPKKEATLSEEKQAYRDRYEEARWRAEAVDLALKMPTSGNRGVAKMVTDAEAIRAFIVPTVAEAS